MNGLWTVRWLGGRSEWATVSSLQPMPEYSFAGEPQPTWTVPLPYGPLAGEPLLDGDAILFASVSGIIWKVDAQTGEELAKIDVKEPLGTGPVVLGKRLLVCGGDGTVHIVSAFSNE